LLGGEELDAERGRSMSLDLPARSGDPTPHVAVVLVLRLAAPVIVFVMTTVHIKKQDRK
jgi:hypothetical protein